MTDKALIEKEQKQVEEAVEKLLSLLEIEGTFEVEAQEDHIEISMETKDTGLVIGFHGEALESLQLILSLIISKKNWPLLKSIHRGRWLQKK